MSGDPIIRFFEGSGTDQDGRTLHDVLELGHDELESDHRYIQWLFPTPEKSSFSYFAPRLTDASIEVFTSRPELQANLRRAFAHILDFYGLRMESGPPLEVVEASTFGHRAAAWVTEGNHNYLRISRILRSLEQLGLSPEATAFLAWLEDLYARRGEVIGERTLSFWRMRARGSGHRGERC